MNFRLAERVNENNEFIARSTAVVRQTNRFQRNILNMLSGLRGYIFTGEHYFVEAYDSAAAENRDILAELSLSIPDSSQQGMRLAEIRKLNETWITEFAKPLMDAKTASGTSVSSQIAFNKIYREKLNSANERNLNRVLQSRFRDFMNAEYEQRDNQKVELTSSIAQTRIISFTLTSMSILIGLAIAIYLAYRISTRIISMVTMADTIAAGNYEAHTPSTGKDELSQLARSLNHMAEVLAENITLLKRKNAELDQFAHIVSHDLKAPLRGIDNVVTWIEEDHSSELSAKMKEYISLIRVRLDRAENLIKGILSYARIGRDAPPIEHVDLRAMLTDIIESSPIPANIQLRLPTTLPIIETERIPLQQVLSNLISNAIKHHDKPDGYVEIGFKDRGSHYEFFVSDNGPGIADSYHEKIFMIFQTLHERDVMESTGVGLAIVKKILEDRHQRVRLKSRLGEGSIFSFTWPKFNKNGKGN